jgi:toxin ParE1/3/4
MAVRHEVLLTRGAEQDLRAIYEYIVEVDGVQRASHVLDQLMRAADSLAHFPERGTRPKELVALGIDEFRQTAFKPYRLIYRVHAKKVIIMLIVDGRRDLQSVLARRLLSP